MRLCLQCRYTRYSKHKGLCPNCSTHLTQVDGRLRKIVESLAKLEYQVAFANCETYTTTDISVAEIYIGFCVPYDNFLFTDLPEHFEFISDKYGYKAPYTLNYMLNHLGHKMSMIVYDYSGDPARHSPADKELKKAFADLYSWTLEIKETKWPVYKLGGWL